MLDLLGGSTTDDLLIGAKPLAEGAQFRVWAPSATGVEVVLEDNNLRYPLESEGQGYFSGVVQEARSGSKYRFSLDGHDPFPDPASRYQPEGPHGPSEIIDPAAYRWSKSETTWPGVSLEGQILYEFHVGTFTPEGTFLSAINQFPRLRDLGITILECMPLGEFAGNVGWGYDGVDLFAPFHHYGKPDDLRKMIEATHQNGLGIILDVVYNHIGPSGNYLSEYSNYYFSKKNTEWGNAINFDGENSLPVREFFLANVAHWIADYHFDGLRLDATQSIYDNGSHGTHILAEIGKRVRASSSKRDTIVVAENEPQNCRLICPVEQNGYGFDAVWNDDFHHSAIVALTGRREGYFSDHLGRPQEFISAAKYGFLYQGQYYAWQNLPRGTSSLGIAAKSFVTFLENHDQIANICRSERIRLSSSPARYRAMTALWLLSPGTPMFFQGQEYGAETPFHFFADHSGELARAVSHGRAGFMLQFASQDTPEMKQCFADPIDRQTFLQSRLDPSEQNLHPEIINLHRDLLALRRNDPVLNGHLYGSVDGAVLGEACFVLRYITPTREDRLVVVNLGAGLDLPHLPEPLVAPPSGCDWRIQWSSEWPVYGGCGSSAPGRFGAWHVQGECTLLLVPGKAGQTFAPDRPKSGTITEES